MPLAIDRHDEMSSESKQKFTVHIILLCQFYVSSVEIDMPKSVMICYFVSQGELL